MYLLDTNIVSLFDPRRRTRAGPIIDWMKRNDRALFISTVTLIEIEAGLLKLRREGRGGRAEEIEALRAGLVADFGDRLLALDAAVALTFAGLADAVRPAVIEWKDLVIAATADAHELTVLTHNLRHFTPTRVPALDPLEALPPDVVP